MKLLTLIIHDKLKQDMADFMHAALQIQGFTISGVEGYSEQSEHDPNLSLRDKVVGYTPRTRITIILEDQYMKAFLNSLNESGIGKDHLVYWIMTVDEFGKM
jgi:nitrogen regulatory protein P-II 1